MERPEAKPVLDLIEAFRRSKVMFVAVEMGIFDRLADEPLSAPDLAAKVGIPADSCERFLDALVSLELLARDPTGLYAVPAVSAEYLVSSSPYSMNGYIRYSNRVLYKLWGDLEGAVKENTHRWEAVYGAPAGSLFDHFFPTEEAMREFLMGMHGFGMLSSPAVVSAFDLSGFHHLADLGGATGHLVMAACRKYPQLSGILFDLPRVAAFAREKIAEAGMLDRVEVASGDFFTDPLPRADLYALGRILHDWSEDKCRLLLKKIAAALPKGGALLISEILLEPDKTGPVAAHMQSLNMLVCTEGRERTAAEYEELLKDAGFREVEHRRTGQPTDAILARK